MTFEYALEPTWKEIAKKHVKKLKKEQNVTNQALFGGVFVATRL